MKRIVIKIGSNILADFNEGLDTQRISSIAREIAELQDMGYDVVIVSSGAIAAGMKKLALKQKPKDIKFKQAAAAIGQSSLMWAYEKSFGDYGRKVAQVLLTRDVFSDRKKYINSKNTILTLLSYKIIPIINENDTVATDEIMFGDNDFLASLVAGLIEAEKFIILSDVEGLYTEDPKHSAKAKVIEHVEEITPEIEKIAGGAESAVGTGGMYSKVIAAKRAVNHGIIVYIISGKKEGLLLSLMGGKHCGTVFKPKKEKLSSKKGWIAYGSRSKGSIVIDGGAVKALIQGGKSLLPSGIISVEGIFETGDAVYCTDSKGSRIAKGLTNYSSSEINKIKGKKTSEIEKVLGYKYSDEAIHRDNLVLL
ncbi:MAG: glutamate 5-kinase [Nitrospirae bacterium RBG_13_39_12]|nr:MAG: glutamate 5-kinase [Nitrospirae bacterium RBG_13_39_12]